MKIIKLKDYVRNYNQGEENSYMNDYALRLAKNTQTADMVEFEEPYRLAGAFSDKFGLLTVTNYLKHPSFTLKTQAEQLEDYLKYSQGFYSLDHLLRNLDQSRKYISGGYNKSTGRYVDSGMYGKNIYRFFCEKLSERVLTLNHPYLKEDICSKSELSSKDTLIAVLSALNEHTVEEVKASIQRSLYNMDKMTDGFFGDANTFPSLDLPYGVHLVGTDDSSWGMCYPTVEEAMQVRKDIMKNPTWDTVDKHLLFTN